MLAEAATILLAVLGGIATLFIFMKKWVTSETKANIIVLEGTMAQLNETMDAIRTEILSASRESMSASVTAQAAMEALTRHRDEMGESVKVLAKTYDKIGDALVVMGQSSQDHSSQLEEHAAEIDRLKKRLNGRTD